jgi:hypothetical protein
MKDLTPAALALSPAEFRALTAHRAKMRQRRIEQRDRTAGFTPVRNQRLLDFYEGQKVLVAVAHTDENGKCSLKPAEIEQKAFNNLRNSLPPLAHQKRHRRPRPSKSDNPVYRTGTR